MELRGDHAAATRELLGVIVYAAAAVLLIEERAKAVAADPAQTIADADTAYREALRARAEVHQHVQVRPDAINELENRAERRHGGIPLDTKPPVGGFKR